MQTVKPTLLIVICTILMSACGFKGPLYLPDGDTSQTPPIEKDLPMGMDGSDDTLNSKDKEQESDPG